MPDVFVVAMHKGIVSAEKRICVFPVKVGNVCELVRFCFPVRFTQFRCDGVRGFLRPAAEKGTGAVLAGCA